MVINLPPELVNGKNVIIVLPWSCIKVVKTGNAAACIKSLSLPL